MSPCTALGLTSVVAQFALLSEINEHSSVGCAQDKRLMSKYQRQCFHDYLKTTPNEPSGYLWWNI